MKLAYVIIRFILSHHDEAVFLDLLDSGPLHYAAAAYTRLRVTNVAD